MKSKLLKKIRKAMPYMGVDNKIVFYSHINNRLYCTDDPKEYIGFYITYYKSPVKGAAYLLLKDKLEKQLSDKQIDAIHFHLREFIIHNKTN